MLRGEVEITSLALVLLVSAPTALVEGYGIFKALKKTFTKSLTLRSLAGIYLIFFFAAVVEVGFVQLLLWVSAS